MLSVSILLASTYFQSYSGEQGRRSYKDKYLNLNSVSDFQKTTTKQLYADLINLKIVLTSKINGIMMLHVVSLLFHDVICICVFTFTIPYFKDN